MDLRQFLLHRSRNPLDNLLKLPISEEVLVYIKRSCPDAVQNEIHKHEYSHWFFKRDIWTNNPLKIEYRHIICMPSRPSSVLRGIVEVQSNPPSLTSIATASLLNHGNLNVEECELAANIIEQCENVMFFAVIEGCHESLDYNSIYFDSPFDEQWNENGLTVNVYGHKRSRNKLINVDICNSGKFHDAQIFFPARPIGKIVENLSRLFLWERYFEIMEKSRGRDTVVGVESSPLTKTKRMRTHL